MQISYITAEMNDDFARAIKVGAEAGVNVVSLRSPVWDEDLESLNEEQIRSIQAILEAHDMRPGMLLSPVGKCSITDENKIARNEEKLKRTVELASRLGSHAVRVFPFRAPDSTALGPSQFDAYFDQIVDRWGPWIEWTAGSGVSLCFEWVTRTIVLTSQEIRRVIDALGTPDHVGAIWEIDVSAQAGEDPTEGYGYIRELLRDVHIKRFGAGATRAQYLSALQLLQRDGYSGPLTIEHWGGEEETLEGIQALQTMREEVVINI